MKYPVADLHCDLLLYLSENSKRSAYDPICRCAIPQFQKGGVVLQVLPVFGGWNQVEIFRNLPNQYPESFSFQEQEGRIRIMLAFESGSSFCGEEEDLEAALNRLETIDQIVYISMTWNHENRFGGGAHTKVGLKKDGKRLLKFMHNRKIAIDMSHTSDYLAYDILEVIEHEKLNIPVIASHSNFRAVTDVPRNLPDEITKEIIKREGVIGLNFVRPFMGDPPEKMFVKQLEHGLKLGGEKNLCLGADFFYREPAGETFFERYGDASCYPQVLKLWERMIDIEAVSHLNLKNFLDK